MRKKIKELLLSIAIMGTAQLSFAQQQDTLKTLLLKEVIVTATRCEKKVSDVGRSITIITIKKSIQIVEIVITFFSIIDLILLFFIITYYI